MTQFDLDFAPLARNSDPITSHLAAGRARELAAHHHRLIVNILSQHGPLGKDGVASRCQITGHAVGKRLAELQRMGRISLTGRNVQSTSGRAEREWVAC
ncbi:MAG: hypothetical protein WBI20_14955 [Burkholderiaceae bacterium]